MSKRRQRASCQRVFNGRRPPEGGRALRLWLRVLVRNATDDPTEVEMQLESERVEVRGSLTQPGSVEPGESRMFDWPAAATAEGTARE